MGDLSKNISTWEIECPCCGLYIPNQKLIDLLQQFFDHLPYPYYTISSGTRCEKHNESVGGSEHSQHIFGNAVDVIITDWFSYDLGSALHKAWDLGFSIGLYQNHLHLDVRPIGQRTWWRR